MKRRTLANFIFKTAKKGRRQKTEIWHATFPGIPKKSPKAPPGSATGLFFVCVVDNRLQARGN